MEHLYQQSQSEVALAEAARGIMMTIALWDTARVMRMMMMRAGSIRIVKEVGRKNGRRYESRLHNAYQY